MKHKNKHLADTSIKTKILKLLFEKRIYIFLIILAIYTGGFLLINLHRFWQYQNFYYDFGIFDTAIWKVSQFQIPIIDKGHNGLIIWADHFNPSIFLFSPLYWFTSRSEIMVIVQVLVVAASAFVAYLMADKLLKNKIAVFSLVISYLGYVGLQNALIFDLHDTTLSLLSLILIFFALSREKWKLFFISLIIFLGFKESNAGAVVGIALYMFIKYRKIYWKQSLAVLIIGIVWGVLSTKFIIPYFNAGNFVYDAKPVPLNPIELLTQMITPDKKFETIFYSLATFGFLPLLNIAAWPVIFEHFFERFILSLAPNRWELGFHYNATLSPLLFISALDIYIWLEKKKKYMWAVSLFAFFVILWVGFYHRVIYHGPFGLSYNPVFYEQTPKVKYQDDFVKAFPKDGKVVLTQNDLAIHANHFSEVRLLRKQYYSVSPDYIILNLTPGQSDNSFFPLNYNEAVDLKNEIIKTDQFELTKFAPEQYLFKKKK